MKFNLTQPEINVLLRLINGELVRLRYIKLDDKAFENAEDNELNFYKALAFKLNKTDGN